MPNTSVTDSSILVVEDEGDIRQLLACTLRKSGYRVNIAASGEDALNAVAFAPPDLILLDLLLPGIDGLSVCELLRRRKKTSHVPIIMLTAKGEEDDIVRGLNAGANDCITKPFSRNVLLARVRATLRNASGVPTPRPASSAPETIEFHKLVIHAGRHDVLVDGKRVELSVTEFRILELLASRPGWVFTREQILDELHGGFNAIRERTVDVHMVALRRRLGSAGRYIHTVRGVGYRLKE
jgi:two-component system phosphate regulon response regulator PhoB